MMRFVLTAALFVVCFSATAAAQTTKAEREVALLRTSIAEAVRAGDRARLEKYIAADFVHTHATGKLNDKAQRIAAMLEGSPTIESVAPAEIRYRTYGSQTVVATGKTSITEAGKTTVYRWTAVYFKNKAGWQLVSTQGTLLTDNS